MANILQFIIDFASRGGNSVVRQAAQLQSRLDAADSSANRLALSVGGRLRSAFMSLPGASFLANPIVAMSTGIGVVSRLGMQAETTATAFDVLVGSTQKAGTMLGGLNKYADDTIWGRKEIQESAKTMLGFTVSAETVTDDLKRLGDIAMGDKQRLQSLALVFGQVASAGKLQGQDLNQLVNAGYNPLQDIAELTGKSMAQVREEMSKGNISYEMFRQAVTRATSAGGRYFGMTDKLAKTTGGSFDRMKGTASQVLLELYNVIQPVLVPAFDTLNKVMESAAGIIRKMAAPVGWLVNAFRDMSPYLLTATSGIGAYTAAMVVNTTVLKGWRIAEVAHYGALLLVEKAQLLVNAAMHLNPIGLIVGGIAALAAGVAICWNRFAGFRAVILTVWDTVKGFAGVIKDLLISRITSLLQSIGKVGEALSRLFRGDFSGAWDSAKAAGSLMLNVDGTRNAIQGMRSVASGISGGYGMHLEQERKKQQAKDAISEPEAAGGTAGTATSGNAAVLQQDTGKALANEITAGGTRSTTVNLTIGSMLEGFHITASGIGETGEQIRDRVLEAVNRALEIGISAAR